MRGSYYYEKLTHLSRFYENADSSNIIFGGKIAYYEEWLRSDMNIKVLIQVKDGIKEK